MFPGQEPLVNGPCCCLWIDCVACSHTGNCATFNYHVYDRVLTDVNQPVNYTYEEDLEDTNTDAVGRRTAEVDLEDGQQEVELVIKIPSAAAASLEEIWVDGNFAASCCGDHHLLDFTSADNSAVLRHRKNKAQMPLNKIFLKTNDFTLPRDIMKKLKKVFRSKAKLHEKGSFPVEDLKAAMCQVNVLCAQDVLHRAVELVVDNGTQDLLFYEFVLLYIILSQENVENDDAFKKLEKEDSQWIVRNSRCTSRARSLPRELADDSIDV